MHDFVIDANHVHDNNTGNQEAIRVHESTQDFAITNNEVNHNVNIGIDVVGWAIYGKPKRGLVSGNYVHHNTLLAQFAAGIYLDGPDSITVEYNVSAFNEYGFQIACEPAEDESKGNVMRYNLAYGNTRYGLGFGGWTGADVYGCEVRNNVFYGNDVGIGFWTNGGYDNTFINNIIVEPAGQSIVYLGTPTSTVIDYNCYYTGFGPTPGANSIFANPLFVSVAGLDFRLQSNSPCVDAGSPATPPGFDLNGVSVPLDGDGDATPRADIGAYEFLVPTAIDTRPRNGAARMRLAAAPNPFNPSTTIRYQVAESGTPTQVGIYDAAGKLIRTLVNEPFTDGERTVVWDGRDHAGALMASGVYFARLTAGANRTSIKLVLLK